MQDGATPHTALRTRALLTQMFGTDNVIGKHFPLSWPPYSPDLTPADFWLWGNLKRLIYFKRSKPFTSVSSLKQAITAAFNKLRKSDFSDLEKMTEKRWRKCIENDGYR